jgi:spectinomycin phosphotransferase
MALKNFGVVQVFSENAGLLLLECATPAVSLKSYFPANDNEAINITANVIKRLHKATIPSAYTFPHIKDWLTALDSELNIPAQTLISPLVSQTGQLWASLESFKAILYPYVEGYNGVEVKLSDQQWIEFGATMKKLHSTNISNSIINNVPRETFSSKWRETVKAFLMRIENQVFEEPVAIKMALFLKSKSSEILNLVERAEKLAITIEKQPLEYILCHADIHGWNLIVEKERALYIVDWDTLIFAPKERDLMFVGAGIWDSGRSATEEESLFYQGYGQTKINQDAICYYRFERIIQDIGDYCEYIFLSDEGGDDRMQCFEHLLPVFLPNGAIERACQSDKTRKVL